jgi:N-acetylated-alpha-linked acidic dipeptidase
VEKHRAELARKTVAYINSDSNGKGTLGAGGSHALEQFMREVLRDNKDPVSGKSLLEVRPPDAKEKEFKLGPLGAGSDYVPFLHHAGIASLNLGFSGGDQGGIYHSIYDSYAWFTKFSDGDFVYGKALANVMSSVILRLSEASVVPLEFKGVSKTVNSYLEEIRKLAGDNSKKLQLGAIEKEAAAIEQSATAYEAELQRVLSSGSNADRLAKVNSVLIGTERVLAPEPGLPGRSWYKHQLYAPGNYTGYSAKTLPVVREAVEANRWDEANRGAEAIASALRDFNNRIQESIRLLKQL